jgi:hypothetical protein
MLFSQWLFLSLLGMLCIAPAFATPLVNSHGHLQFPAVRQSYSDGDFDDLRKGLEAFLKRQNKTASRDELVVAYKYLGAPQDLALIPYPALIPRKIP